MILGPLSNQVACTPLDLATHIAVCAVSGGQTLHTLSIDEALVSTGDWTQVFNPFVTASGGIYSDLDRGLILGIRIAASLGTIVKGNMDGTGSPTTIFSGSPVQSGLAFDSANEKIFFRSGSVTRFIKYDGTDNTGIASNGSWVSFWYDHVNDWLYMTRRTGADGWIARMRSDGSGLVDPWKSGIAYGNNFFMAGDVNLGKLWWIDDNDGIYETDLATSVDTLLVPGRTASTTSIQLAYHAGRDKLFYASGTTLFAFDRGTATESALIAVPTSSHRAVAFAVD